MDLVTRLAAIEAVVLLVGFFGVVVYKLVVGEIALGGLLYSKDPDGRSTFSPARLQLLIFTVAVAARYLNQVLADPRQESLPTLPASVVIALGASHAAYLGGKVVSAYIQPLLKKNR